ncbi:alpha/beta fold hydrolase [Neobacillus niacini]|uniref:alpha/beta fold hydrolase n=1 Tax=Neobacillus niacini TaxID=86668 RepID=UPI001C8E0797|nr:alpha/beta hydrolase [Neobacillus niacini]MBY0147320.1 alpha/beta hydrolase [Neobacillus niacini]
MAMLEMGDGTSLYFSVIGDGIPIVFIHPPLLTSENFRYQINELSHTFKVITFDIRGHGKSEYSPIKISYPLIVEDMKRLLEHLGIEKVILCGYSTGVSVALEFMLTYPGRAIGGILVSGMSEASDFYLRQRISIAIKLANPSALSFLAKAITYGNSDSRETFTLLYNEAIKGDARNINQYFQNSVIYSCTEQLEQINLPILLIYGKKDKSFYRCANLLSSKLPKSNLIFLDKEKHQIPTKAADKLNQLITNYVENNKL